MSISSHFSKKLPKTEGNSVEPKIGGIQFGERLDLYSRFFGFFRFFLFFSVILLILSSCLPSVPKIDPEIFYKRDMILEINGYRGVGHLVVPQSDEYDFKIEAKGDLDLFVMSSCHRVISIEEAGEGGIFGNKRKVKIKYRPISGIEDEACPVILEGYEMDKGRHSWGYVDFQEKNAQVLAKVKCNGVESIFKGVSTCQSSQGTIQEILFERPVYADWSKDCAPAKSLDEKNFRIILSRGLCVYGFAEKENHKNLHRLTILGFEKIMLRKN